MRMLAFLTRRFRWLRGVPGLPAAVDAAFHCWAILCARPVYEACTAVAGTAASWENVSVAEHRFGGTEFRLGRKEIGHLHANGVLDIPFRPADKADLLRAGAVVQHHTNPGSGYASFPIRGAYDVQHALDLLRFSYDRHRKVPITEGDWA